METWKPIPGFEGIYEASDLGQIRTAEGKTTRSARFEHRVWKQRVLKPKIQTRSHGRKDKRVSLWKDGEGKTYLVARLVAMAFLPAPYDTLTVNHKNGDSMDNRAENLEWVTLAENIRHGFKTGLYSSSQKKVRLISLHNGEICEFESMAAAGRWLGHGNGYINCCMTRGQKAISNNGERFDIEVMTS